MGLGRAGGRGPNRMLAALAGVAATVLGVGAGELVAGLLGLGSPVLAVGSLGIDLAPAWAKETAIALFGTGDKAALVVGIGLVLLGLAVVAGMLEARRPPLGAVLLGLEAALALVATLTRSGAGPWDALAPVSAGALGVATLRMLVARLPAHAPARPRGPASPADDAPAIDRRGFLGWAAGAAAVGALAAVLGSVQQGSIRAVQAVRNALRLPPPATPAAPIPAAAELGIDGLAPFLTPNADFYRIDTALAVPNVDPAQWRLRVHGLVDAPFELSWPELLAMPLVEHTATIACVSNEVGGDLVGNATWLGFPVREALLRARPRPGADMVLSRSVDGFTASTPLAALQDPGRAALLAVGMNGEPLPPEHGFPVRMIVPGLYGYVSATKWLVDLEVTTFARATAYWTERGWSAEGPVKLASRIDVPRNGARVPAGDVVVAGVAWHPHTGIDAVHVRADGGAWQAAELAAAASIDTWRQWRWTWRAEPGDHELEVRATGADGEVQTAVVRPVVPDGATGWHRIRVDVG